MTTTPPQFAGRLTLLMPAPGMSDEDFFAFCQLNRELPMERNARGEITIMSPTGSETGHWNSLFNGMLFMWNQQSQMGRTFDSSTGFTLPNGAIYGPDAAWLSHEKWNSISAAEKRKFAPLVPDFVMELRSPSDPLEPLQAKIADFLTYGCQLAWLIDPTARQTTVSPADGRITAVPFAQILEGGPVLPGFKVVLGDLLV